MTFSALGQDIPHSEAQRAWYWGAAGGYLQKRQLDDTFGCVFD